ncbi:MAG: ABC transporter permease [Anaerolineaceae bacterium]|nr:ABC transporter permease [Anaerolineaceae bacterium]
MNIWRPVIEAIESIAANKLRSGLTMLGIVIGVAAVIAMLAVGSGAQNTINQSIGDIGTNLLFVFSGNMTDPEAVRQVEPLTMGDAEAIGDPFIAPNVDMVAPVLAGSGAIAYGGETTTAEIYGVTPDYESVRNYSLTEGSFIDDDHLLARSSVVLVGPDVAKKLFDREEGVTGEAIRIDGHPFKIIGVLESKGGSTMGGSQDNVVLIPLTTARNRILRRGQDRLDIIFVQVINSDSIDAATEEISQVLRVRHRIFLGADDFSIISQEDFIDTANQITGIFTIFLGGVAGISLLVGGIGIMNIMLVSVTERTREIGLRKAVGAKRSDILIQFLIESSLLSLLGGLIGIGFGYFLAFLVGMIAKSTGNAFSPAVELNAILLATLFSTAVGLFFGIYPANRAAKLQPVEALRSE